jgi:benzodiazapine receptor
MSVTDRAPDPPQFSALAIFGGVTALAAALGGWLTSRGVGGWFKTLRKPPFNPPDWVFGPVWTVLYAAMAAAAWLVWRRGPARDDVQRSTRLFGAQLGLNVLWSGLFFALKSPLLALAEIVTLWSAIALWLRSAARIDARARWLIVPYLAWVSFATLLNASIWWLNRGRSHD